MLTGGCALLHPAKKPPATAAAPAPAKKPDQPKAGNILSRLTHPLAGFHPFARTPPPPKAQVLRRVGIIRTLSNDGSYVIVELEPGVMVSAGAALLVTATGGEPARLRTAEVQPPYFVADIESGNPQPGDPVVE